MKTKMLNQIIAGTVIAAHLFTATASKAIDEMDPGAAGGFTASSRGETGREDKDAGCGLPKSCDLSVQSKVIRRENLQTVATIKGGYDYTGRKFWWDIVFTVLLAPTVLGLGWYIGEGYDSDSLNSDRADVSWYKNANNAAEAKCRDFIRANYPDDISVDDGDLLVARHYECGQPYEEKTAHGVRIMIGLKKGEPVYEKLTWDQVEMARCEKLLLCDREAKNPTFEEISCVHEAQIKFGCS